MSHSDSVVGATTAPEEALSSLHQRLLVTEEQAEALVRDMGSLGVSTDHHVPLPKESNNTSFQLQPVSPLKVHRSAAGGGDGRPAAVGGESTLWRQKCDSLVSRVCHLENLLQTLRLATFRLETERALDPSHPARLKEQLTALQQENMQEQRASRREAMRLQDQLRQASDQRDQAHLEAQRLSEALEVATAAKMDTAVAAEELKVINEQMSEKLSEMEQQTIQDSSLSFKAMKSHSELLQQLEDMERVVEMERRQAQLVHADCQALHSEGQASRQTLQAAQDEARRLRELCQWLQEQTEAKELLVSELKSVCMALQKQQKENNKLLKEGAELRAAADKVQAMNDGLERQCSELSCALCSLTVENAQQQTEHQASLKAERNRVIRHLQEHDLLLEATRRNVRAELQGALSERVSLQTELEKLKADHSQLLQCSATAQETAVTQRQLLERTISRLRGELSAAQRERGALRKDLDGSQNELRVVVTKLETENIALERRLSEAKREAGCLSSALHRQEEENRRLMGKMAAMEQQPLESLRKALDTARLDNRTLAQSLEQAVMTNVSLQNKLEQTGHHTHRGEELHEARTKISHLSEQLDALQRQMTKDKEASRRTLHREISELKRSLEDSSNCRSGDLSKTNRELRKRVSELEKLVSKQKARIRLQKSQLRQQLESRGALEDVRQNVKEPEESDRWLQRGDDDDDDDVGSIGKPPHDARMESQQALGEGDPEWKRWTSIVQRWEAKRELARIAGCYRPGRTQLPKQSP